MDLGVFSSSRRDEHFFPKEYPETGKCQASLVEYKRFVVNWLRSNSRKDRLPENVIRVCKFRKHSKGSRNRCSGSSPFLCQFQIKLLEPAAHLVDVKVRACEVPASHRILGPCRRITHKLCDCVY